MALLELDAAGAEALIADCPDVTLAVHASPRQSVIAGPPDQIDALIAKMQSRNLLARRIEVDVASHHPTVDPILAELRAALAGLAPTTPKIPLISTTHSGDGNAPVLDADHWVANLRNPVRFSQAVAAVAANHATFVEVSPIRCSPIPSPMVSPWPGPSATCRCSQRSTVTTTSPRHFTPSSCRCALRPAQRHCPMTAGDVSSTSRRHRGSIRPTGWRVGRGRGRKRRSSATGYPHRDAVGPRACVAGRTSEPISYRGLLITRCTANPSCLLRVSRNWCWPPAPRPSTFRPAP